MADMDFSQAFTYSDINKVYLMAVELSGGLVSQHGSVQLERIFQDSTLYAQVSALKNEMESILQNFTGASEYDDTATYAVGDYCTKDDYLYQCNTAVSAESWDASKWDVVTISSQYTMLKNILGVDDYSTSASYAVGDLVVYDGKMYRCITAVSSEAWDASKWSETSFVAESKSIMTEIQAEGATQVANVQSVYADDMAEVNAKVSRNTKEIANLVQKEGVVSISYPDSIYGRGEVPAGMAKFAEVSCLRGVSRVANQLVPLDTTKWTSENVLGSVSSQTIVVKPSTDSTGVYKRYKLPVQSGHTYLVSAKVKTSNANYTAGVALRNSNGTIIQENTSSTTLNPIVFVASATGSDTRFDLQVQPAMPTSEQGEFTEVILTDLTLYFGGSIPSDADTIAEIQQNYPELLVPSDYDTGSLVDTTHESVGSRSRNVWDEEYDNGYIGNSDGQPVDSSAYVRSANYIPVLPLATYYAYIGDATSARAIIYFYDADKNFITGLYANNRQIKRNETFSTPTTCFFIKFYIESDYGSTYNNDVCINLSDAHNGTYTPHFKSTLTLPSPVTLRSAGSVADTDELCVEVDGVEKRRMTTRIASVDLSTLSFTYNSELELWYALFTSGVPFSSAKKNLLYHVGTSESYLVMNVDKTMLGYYMNDATASGYERIYVRNGSSTVAPTGIFYYELADPVVTLTDPILDNFLPTEAGGTITPKQTQSKQIDTSFDINYLAV